jgi:hypothetical protein
MRVHQVVAGTVLVLATAGALAACGSVKPTAIPTFTTPVNMTTTVAPTTTTTTDAPSVKTVYVQPPATHTVYMAPPAPVLTVCSSLGVRTPAYEAVYAGPNTSCQFAWNVASNYIGPGPEYAYSPVTGESYLMNCDIAGAGTVICTGGNNAYVQF